MTPVSRVGWKNDGSHSREDLIDKEWLVTNGLGGYASGTIAGVVTRRYHGLLVAALANPFGRTMMLDHLVERVQLPDGTQRRLSAYEHVSGMTPQGGELLQEFRLEMGLPVWIYRVDAFTVEKRLILAYMQNTVHLRYRLLDAPLAIPNGQRDREGSLVLSLRPAMHFRPHDAPVSRPMDAYTLSLVGNRFEVSTQQPAQSSSTIQQAGLPSLKMRVDGDNPTFQFFPEKQEKVNYRWESARGYESHGTLWSPGHFKVTLTAEAPAALIASTESWDLLDAISPENAGRYENERRARLLHIAPGALTDTTTAELVLAADQFVIAPAGRVEDAARARAQGEELRSVIAGYHWFTDWGRDTMISLEGLTLCTGRHQTAHFILHTFAQYVRKGLIPNLFPEGSRDGLYHTADATLWFMHALDRYLAYTGDHETLRLLLPTLEGIIDAHVRGTDFGIGVDSNDGLLRQGQDGFALTWMDALCEGWVVTPRRGKAVEINALWFNALTLMAGWVKSERGEAMAARYLDMAHTAQDSFNRLFWDGHNGRLFDVIDSPGIGQDRSFRPNQILAVSLPNPVLDPGRWKSVVDAVSNALLTPVGLRSLAPDQPDFKPTYHGDLRTRDAAYHQGTVWSWLIGPFIDAWLKVYPEARSEGQVLLHGLRAHLGHACVGSISEVFDAEAPYLPRGCIAQAWGVAEFLRAWGRVRTDSPTGDSVGKS